MNTQSSIISADKIIVGFGWDAFLRQRSGGLISGILSASDSGVDCDGAAIVCDRDGRPLSDKLSECCVYYGNLKMFDNAIVHHGDDQTGKNSGDDEMISIDLKKLPENVGKIILTMDLFKEKKRSLTIGKIHNTYVRVIDENSAAEIVKESLAGTAAAGKIVATGALVRGNSGEWTFEPAQTAIHEKISSMQEFIDCLCR